MWMVCYVSILECQKGGGMCCMDLGKPTHRLVPCWIPKPSPPRNQCTGWFTPNVLYGGVVCGGDLLKPKSGKFIGGVINQVFPNMCEYFGGPVRWTFFNHFSTHYV